MNRRMKMKKLLAIIMCLFVVFTVCGCASSDRKTILGRWEGSDVAWTFTSDGTFLEHQYNGWTDKTLTGTYSIDDDILTVELENDHMYVCTFSVEENVLIINMNGEMAQLTKTN